MDPISLALGNQRRKPKPKPPYNPGRPDLPVRPPTGPRPPAAGTSPTMPDFSELLAELSAGPKERTEEEWASLLDPRMKPYTDAIEGSTLRARAFNEYNFETKAEQNRLLGEGMISLLSGGKTGEEARQFAKANFGGSFLPEQIGYMATTQLNQLTSDFDTNDWKITSDYLTAMQELPSLREEVRERITRDDISDYERRVTTASLLIEETWKAYGEGRRIFEADRDFNEGKRRDTRDFNEGRRQYEDKIKTAREALRRQQGISGYDDREDAAEEAKAMSSQTGRVYTVARASDGSWVPVDTGKKVAGSSSNANGVRSRNSALTEARDMTKGSGNIWRVRKEGGSWVAYDTGEKATGSASEGSSSPKLSFAQKAERDLAVSVLTEYRDSILGGTSSSGVRSAGMKYEEAYDYIYSLAEAELGPYGRRAPYLNKWVKDRLRALGIIKRSNPAAAKPRGG